MSNKEKHNREEVPDDANSQKESSNDALSSIEQNGTKPEKSSEREPLAVTITDIELEQLKRDTADYKDKYLRNLAEMENARKRLQKEKQELIQFSTQNLIAEFLHPLDHLENALKFTQEASEELKHWGLGFQMILTQFKDVLASNGITQIESKGKPFDPHVHEAVETIETKDYPPGTIVEEFVRGYKMGDRLVRAARVKVAKAPSVSVSEDEKNEDQEKTNHK